jgi:long-chain acyl-CoA synthetase
LNGLERVRKVHIIDYAFSVANDLMTPTFKVKRNQAKKAFQVEIDEMYSVPLDA